MKWNRPSEPDVKDQWIQDLRERNAALELENRDLRRELLSVLKPAAYKQVHGQQEAERVIDLGEPIPRSPSAIPPYKLEDAKMWESVLERMEKKLQHD